MAVVLKRAYDPVLESDGFRVLVDRLWPRGLRKETARVDQWLRDLAPSDKLRRWFHQNPSEWLRFRKRYVDELREPAAGAALEQLYGIATSHRIVTLLFASKDSTHNNAVVLKELLEGMRKPPTSTGPSRANGAVRVRQSHSRQRS